MTHEEVLNMMLAETCSNPSEDGEEWSEYTYEAHCTIFTIVAKCVNRSQAMKEDDTPFKYEIKCVKDGKGRVI